jgi:hypothetical protein
VEALRDIAAHTRKMQNSLRFSVCATPLLFI